MAHITATIMAKAVIVTVMAATATVIAIAQVIIVTAHINIIFTNCYSYTTYFIELNVPLIPSGIPPIHTYLRPKALGLTAL